MKFLFIFTLLFSMTAWSAELTVLNTQGEAIVGAEVLVDGMLGTTDSTGTASIESPFWSDELPVTIKAKGYVTKTILDVMPGDHQFILTTANNSNRNIEISGNTTSYGRLRTDGMIDFSLVIPALTRRDFISFDANQVVSPVKDSITVLGQTMELPSNLSLPKQRESYIIPITLEKLKYRMFVNQTGFYKMSATHGRFPLKKVVDEFRDGKSVFEVINEFTFIGGGQKDLQVTGDMAGQDIAINQLLFDNSISIEAPSFAPGLEMVSISLVNQGDYYMPADMKKMTSAQTTDLKFPQSVVEPYTISVLMHRANRPAPINTISNTHDLLAYTRAAFSSDGGTTDDENADKDQMSIAFELADQHQPVSFLPMIAKPTVVNDQIQLDKPTTVAGVEAVGTMVVLSEITQKRSGNSNVEIKTRKWELLTNSWVDTLSFPKNVIQIDPSKKYRWDVMFLGRTKSATMNTNGDTLDTVTHITRNSLDF